MRRAYEDRTQAQWDHFARTGRIVEAPPRRSVVVAVWASLVLASTALLVVAVRLIEGVWP